MLDIWDALETGWDRARTDNGLIFMGLFFITSVFASVFSGALTSRLHHHLLFGLMEPSPAVSLPIPAPAIALLWAATGVATVVIMVGALRTFVTDEEKTVPEAVFTDRIFTVFFHLLIGGIVYGFAVALGFALFIVPGIYLMVSLLFWTVYVVAEDDGFYQAMQHSWALADGERLRILGLGFAVMLVTAAVNVVFTLPTFFTDALGFSLLLSEIAAAFTTVYTLAVVAAAYRQLT